MFPFSIRNAFALALIASAPFAAATSQQPPARSAAQLEGASLKQFTPADLQGWKSIRSATLSDDGKWFAYVSAPNEGDAEVVVRPTAEGGKEWRYGIGEPPAQQGGGGPGAAAGGSSLVVSGDSKWVAFTIYPTQRDARRARQSRRPLQNKVALVNLATGEKKEFDKVRRFAMNGDHPAWIALHTYPAEAAGAAGNGETGAPAPAPGGGGRGAGAGAAAARSESSDLLLYNLGTAEMVNVGNVAEFAFDEAGEYLAYVVDVRDGLGNGVQLRNMKTDAVRSLDNDRAIYKHLTWADSTQALAVLRGRADSVRKDTLYDVLTFTAFRGDAAKKVAFRASEHSEFPSGMRVSPDRAPRFAEDLSAVFFGISETRKPVEVASGRTGGAGASLVQAGAPGAGGRINQPGVQETDDALPSLVLWHWNDPRLQSQQIVEESQDKSFSYLSEYRFAENRFIRLADDGLRNVNLLPHQRYAMGTDTRGYDQPGSYTGRRYADVYGLDVKTGERKLGIKKLYVSSGQPVPSPRGDQLLYWGQDGNYWVVNVATGETRNITKGVATSFANHDDDHYDIYPAPQRSFGWAADGSSVLLYDGWDAWKVPVDGGSAVNLTVDGRKRQVRFQQLYTFDAGAVGGGRGRGAGPGDRPGIDLSKPLYFGTYGEWTKKEGLSRVQPGTAGAESLVWDDANINYIKAKSADVFLYTRQTFNDFPNYFVASADLKSGRQITDANPQQKEFAWSSGARLINYVSAKGDKLQGALYLPANYEPGKKYPLLVTIYEKRSQLLHQYNAPSDTRTPDASVYTSRGYAVLDPDIVYKVNDPGMSAVWCVVPAVKAAIATGVVDSQRVGLWGHSWGGYQTAFLVTQTNIFKAAIAGAPLTDMVSMYSSIYWNTGGTNQGIFESSQGRFKGNYTDNYDAYIRNSPVFHAANVKTPLVILHDDKDGAVDFNQGITYYNTLRQLGKQVILLEYVGENHGLARPVNMKDYAARQREWFDHYLKEAPAPEWMTNGIPRLKLEDELRQRRDADKPRASATP